MLTPLEERGFEKMIFHIINYIKMVVEFVDMFPLVHAEVKISTFNT